jgi:hypothetical protein
MADFSPRVNEDNPDPRIACALLLDTSYSMSGKPIEQLNRGFGLFCEEIKKDELAQKRAEIAVSDRSHPQLSIWCLRRVREQSHRRQHLPRGPMRPAQ